MFLSVMHFSKLIFFLFVCLITANTTAQDLEQNRKDIIGVWRLDMDKSREVYQTVKDFIPKKRIKEFEQFQLYYETYQLEFRDDGSCSVSFRVDGRNVPSMDETFKLELVDFTKKELSMVGKAPIFNNWASQMSAVWIMTKRDDRIIIKLNKSELTILDEGAPMVFSKVE